MNSEKTIQHISYSSDETIELGNDLGKKLKGGEVIVLTGDMGSGKTTFVKGIASGLGSHELVHSPSFTLVNQYSAGNLILHHFDFHRLSEPGIMRELLAEILTYKQNIAVIEWAEIVADVLPPKHLVVKFRTLTEDSRGISYEFLDNEQD